MIGKVLGLYTVLRIVGGGGQSVIYEARSDTGRVAIKLLNVTRERSEESDDRLRREAEAIKQLEHPNVVRLIDHGETPDGIPWLAMEFLEGETLAQHLKRFGTLTQRELLKILRPVCEAVAAAHRNGIVHRDLKPQNIMLTAGKVGRVPKILDFGIAALEGANALTSSMTLKGTPMYMAPEQWDGLKNADHRSDVYALGAIAYEALAGMHAFDADTPLAWMKKVQFESPRELSVAAGPRVSPGVCSTVMRALAKDPRDRPQSPLDFIARLEAAGADARLKGSWRRWLWPLAVLVTGVSCAVLGANLARWSALTPPVATPRTSAPTVVIMDTPVAHGVYDSEALRGGGTNADTLSDLLRDLPVTIQKETVRSTWNREAQIIAMKPDLIVIHRSAFFHAMNVEFGFGYPPFVDPSAKSRWDLLYRTADDKLVTFLGLAGIANPSAKFLVYSRGTGSDWPDAQYRNDWATHVEQRFPALRNRVDTMTIEGGVETGSFKNPQVVRELRGKIISALGLRDG